MASRCRELDQLIDYTAGTLADQLKVKFTGVAIRGERDGNLVFRGGRGWPSELYVGTRIPAPLRSAAHRMLASGKPIVIGNLPDEKRFKPPRGLLAQGVLSGMVAQIGHEGRLIGLIGVFSATARAFAATDLNFLQAVANVLGSALENDGLRSELERAAAIARRDAELKTLFIANASHEIRSPLNVILGYCELISERLSEAGDPNAAAWMGAVERAGSRLLGTIDDILDFSHLESGTIKTTTELLMIAPLVESVARTAAPAAAAKKIGLSCLIDAPDVVIRGDRRSLVVALTKLIGNAIKFTANGAVLIKLAQDAGQAPRLEISDSGVGIAPDYIARLFEPFSQERANYARPFEGIGLGLAIAHRYLELNDAQISVRSEKGRGTTFTIRLPAHQATGRSKAVVSGDRVDALPPSR